MILDPVAHQSVGLLRLAEGVERTKGVRHNLTQLDMEMEIHSACGHILWLVKHDWCRTPKLIVAIQRKRDIKAIGSDGLVSADIWKENGFILFLSIRSRLPVIEGKMPIEHI